MNNSYIQPFTFRVDDQPVEDFNFSIDMDKLSTPMNIDEVQNTSDTQEKKKRGRPKKKTPSTTVMVEDEQSGNLPLYQSNEPYLDSYKETTDMLNASINQIDIAQNQIRQDLDLIRSSKTLKRKYDYISMLTGSVCSLIGTKVTAIREINKSITDSHNLDIKRVKELKMNAANVDDNKSVMDMYNAFISMPSTSPMTSSFIPANNDMTFVNQSPNIITSTIGGNDSDLAYQSYINNLSPTQNMMLMEDNANIKTVVVYDPDTGNRWFDVMDMSTGQSVPNTPKPDSMFLEDTTIDMHNKIARNINLDQVYPLIILNQTMNEY